VEDWKAYEETAEDKKVYEKREKLRSPNMISALSRVKSTDSGTSSASNVAKYQAEVGSSQSSS